MKRLAVKLSILRDIGWAEWDPIGLSNGSWPEHGPDEYDKYLLHAASLAIHGSTVVNISAYLAEIEADYIGMGMRGTTIHRSRRTAVAIKEYVDSIST